MAEIISNPTLIVNEHENEKIQKSCKDVPSQESEVISEIVSTMIENIHNTSNKVDKPQDFNNIKCTNKNTNSPHKNIYLFNKNNLLKSPLFKKLNKCAQSIDTTQINTNICSQKNRTISINSDYDIFKSELYNIESELYNFKNFENIDLLHDLDSTIKFEDNKDMFLSLTMNTTQENDNLLGMNKDPIKDPLSISDHEKEDIDTHVDSHSVSSKRKIKEKSKSQKKKQKSEFILRKSHFKEKKHKLDMEEKHLLEELNNFDEWEEMPLIDIKKLLELHIELIHKVPPQHKIEFSGSHAPTKKQKKLFQKHGPIRNGLYSPIEDKIIKKNWNTFCKLHDWDTKKTKPFLYWRHNGRYYINDIKERQKFVQFLANGLPWRTLYSVYSRFKVLYRNEITYARYTTEEDNKILMYIKNEHLDERYNKYSELAKLLGRTGRSIFKRYQYLKSQIGDKSETKPSVKWGLWTLPLIKKFIKTLLSVTINKDIRELKDALLPKPVWQKMEEKLNIPEKVLKIFWQNQLHLQLFSTSPIYLNDIKIQLIEYMYAKGISNTREIIWSNVAQHFDGATGIFLCKVFFYLIQECNMSEKKTKKFANVVKYLYHTKIPKIKKASTDKFLPRIIYEDGQISLLDMKNSKTITTDDYRTIDYSTDS